MSPDNPNGPDTKKIDRSRLGNEISLGLKSLFLDAQFILNGCR
jgi:hypothetical protein